MRKLSQKYKSYVSFYMTRVAFTSRSTFTNALLIEFREHSRVARWTVHDKAFNQKDNPRMKISMSQVSITFTLFQNEF